MFGGPLQLRPRLLQSSRRRADGELLLPVIFVQSHNSDAVDSNVVASRLLYGIHHLIGLLNDRLRARSVRGISSHSYAGSKLDREGFVAQPFPVMKHARNTACHP